MNRTLVYLIGIPGSGKSTVMRTLLEPYTLGEIVPLGECPHLIGRRTELTEPDGLPDVIAEIGRRRDSFSGTDALAMNIQPAAAHLLEILLDLELVLAEGDGLANDRYFTAARTAGWGLRVVFLDTPDEIAAERRAARGSNQNETWLRGRITKVRRLVDGHAELVLDGTKPVDQIAADLRTAIAFWLTYTGVF